MSDEYKDLPEGWSNATIEELCLLNPKHDRDLPEDLEVSFVPMAAVSDLLGAITDEQIRPFGEVRKGYTHFADGDVIFAKITPCMENGKAASVRGMKNGLACGTTEFFVFRSQGAVDQDYLFRFVRQESYRKAARAQMKSGVGQARVPKDFVLQTKLPVPPLAEQRRIVAKIEALQERSRKARELLTEVKPLLEQFRQSVLAAAFRGDLTADWRKQNPNTEPASELLTRIRTERRQKWEEAELAKYEAKGKKPPKGWQDKYKEPEPLSDYELKDLPPLPDSWCWASLMEVHSATEPFCYGVVQPGPEVEDGAAMVRVCDLEDGRILVDQLRKIGDDIHESYGRCHLRGGEVLVSVVGTIGRVAITDESVIGANIARAIARITPIAELRPEWIAETITSQRSYDWLNRGVREVARKTLNLNVLERLAVPLAPQTEMDQIIELLRGAKESVQQLESIFAVSVSSLAQLDQSILAKAFRGELVPQDPNDEPASVLLERIREQREAATKKGKKSTRGRGKQKAEA